MSPWDVKPDSITFVATDTRKLVKYRSTMSEPGVTGSCIEIKFAFVTVVCHLYRQIVIVDIECDTYVWHRFKQVSKAAGINAELSFALSFKHRHFCRQSGVTGSCIMPVKPSAVIKNVFPRDTQVKVTIDAKRAMLEAENVKFSCQLLKGSFPDYNRVIPVNNPYAMTVDRGTFL